jgi:xanthine dehydrogenase small subunit
MTHPLLQFVRHGEIVSLPDVPPTRTLLQVLREDLACSDTKEGCNEGDCGACTVVLAEKQGKHLHYSAVNSCIKMAQSINRMALWTAQDLAAPDGTPHPVQQALVQCHASQCGFCTPGFAMSLFGLYQNQVCQGVDISRTQAQEALSGNLCRCTGYRPILDAAQHMAQLPIVTVNEAEVLQKLELINQTERALEPDLSYISPTSLKSLLAARAAHPQAQIVAGCTDVGLWVNKMHMNFAQVLDITQVAELKRIEVQAEHTLLGAALTLTQAFAALQIDHPQLHSFFARFAGLPVRNAGTLGGNVANGSPIGDTMPLLIALNANVVLMSQRGTRELPLETLYTGYRKNVMAADEVLAFIKIPKSACQLPCEASSTHQSFLQAYKVSKRFEDDISAVCLAVQVRVQDGVVTQASIGAGGVAATPVRALQTQAALVGQPWTQATISRAMSTLQAEFQPISDMRAQAAYRTQVLGNLLQRFWLESRGEQHLNLATFTAASLDLAESQPAGRTA